MTVGLGIANQDSDLQNAFKIIQKRDFQLRKEML